jgi:hypothetical protein
MSVKWSTSRENASVLGTFTKKMAGFVAGAAPVLLAPLTLERMFAWHTAIFPTGRSGLVPLLVGMLRGAEPMQFEMQFGLAWAGVRETLGLKLMGWRSQWVDATP